VQANLHAGDLYLVQMRVVKMGDQKKLKKVVKMGDQKKMKKVVKMGDQKKMKKVVKMGAMNSRVVSYHP
jgi:hypothetical protein